MGRSRNPAMAWLVGVLLSLALTLAGPVPMAVQAYDNPELLPGRQAAVIDLARVFTEPQRQSLNTELERFEAEQGWKIRVLTQYDRTPGLAVKEYWDLDETSLLVVADPRGGNLLNFNVGEALFALMPRTYWVELQTRFGNQFFVRDNGEDAAVLTAVHSVEGCLEQGGCQVVPGLPREQWLLTLAISLLGGLVVGFAAHPRRRGDTIAWTWVLLLSPLWVMLFGVLGLGPVLTRTHDALPILCNSIGFLATATAAYLTHQLWEGRSEASGG
ncbi:MAG: TPM domain-containing protein [Aphanocapsa feldmannii 288cV]|nr:MAG: TPM domain-containing protein [Aphanocapsa feldmannii 288cV]